MCNKLRQIFFKIYNTLPNRPLQQTAMLGALYVAAVGFGMVYVGIAFTANLHLGDFDTLYKKIFSGGLIACFFWVKNNNNNNN